MTRLLGARSMARDWALGGIFGESGGLERPVTPNILLVPGSVAIQGKRLVWTHQVVKEKQLAAVRPGTSRERYPKLIDRYFKEGISECYMGGGREEGEFALIQKIVTHPAKIVLPGSKILDEFVRLSDGSRDAIRDYALKWGVLGICQHGVPRTHRFHPIRHESLCMPIDYRSIDDLGTHTAWEPLSAWRYYSRLARGILDIASRLHQGELVDDKSLWKRAGIHCIFPDEFDKMSRRVYQQFSISAAVNTWLEAAGVRPFFSWGGNEEATVALGTTVLGFSSPMQKEFL